MKIAFIFITMLWATSSVASEWIPYVANTYPTIEVPTVPSVTYSNIMIPMNTIRYQWIPIYYNRPVIINNYGLFIKKQEVVYEPQIQWILQPIYYK
jgi:hypothetical protein